jgi:hypothetical protein
MKKTLLYADYTFNNRMCTEKFILKKVINSSNSISLDAYEGNGSNRIRSIINSKESNKINLDGKEYDIVQFKSIVDTIKGEYSLKVENSKKIVRIIRIR